MRIAPQPLSLEEPLNADSDAELGDRIADRSAASPFDAAITALLPAETAKMLARLTDRERRVITLRFGLDCGEPRTLEDVGRHFDLTRERIRQIEANAMAKLRHPSFHTNVRDLFDD